MKKINDKVKYSDDPDIPHGVKLFAKKNGEDKYIHFANCHRAMIPLLKEDFKSNMNRLQYVK